MGFSTRGGWVSLFCISPADAKLRPFLYSFAKAANQMPSLKKAVLWSPFGDSLGVLSLQRLVYFQALLRLAKSTFCTPRANRGGESQSGVRMRSSIASPNKSRMIDMAKILWNPGRTTYVATIWSIQKRSNISPAMKTLAVFRTHVEQDQGA